MAAETFTSVAIFVSWPEYSLQLECIMVRESLRRFILSAALLLAPLSLAAQTINTDRNGVAGNGHDLVSYFTDNEAAPGLATITATHEGATYRFTTEAHRDAFVADPVKYLPVYGGYCAYGVSNGYKVKTDPEAFTVIDGRLYLNYDKGVQGKWKADIPGYIAKADSNWKKIKDAPRK